MHLGEKMGLFTFSIKTRIAITFILLGLIILSLLGFSVFTANQFTGAINSFTDNTIPPLAAARAVNVDLQQALVAERTLLLPGLSAKKFTQEMETLDKNITQLQGRFKNTDLTHIAPEILIHYNQYLENLALWLSYINQFKALLRTSPQQARELSLAQGWEIFDTTETLIDLFADTITEGIDPARKAQMVLQSNFFTGIILLGSFGLLIALFSGWRVFRYLQKSFSGLHGAMHKISSGEGDLTQSIEVKKKDEIGRVALAFNSFLSKLRSLIGLVKEAVTRTSLIKLSLSSSIEETSASIEEISANIDSILKQTGALDSNVQSNASVVQSASKDIASLDKALISQASMLEQSTSAISEMMSSLGNLDSVAKNKRLATNTLAEVSNLGRNTIQDTNEKFIKVVQYIQQIQEMADTINSIAAQTNLLSMNAAIEAAHAGESGKGFAVVAEEIRKLADSAGASSKAITGLIKDITTSVEETNLNLSESSHAFEAMEDEVRSTIGAFQEIESALSEINLGGNYILEETGKISSLTSNITQLSKSIRESSQTLLSNGNSLQQVSEVVTTGIAETKAGASEIVGAMQQMILLSVDLSKIVEELKIQFDRFTV